MGEVHLHGEDTDILGARLRGVDGGAVGVDAVDSWHIGREIEGEERRGWVGGGGRKMKEREENW